MSDQVTSQYLSQFWLPIETAPKDGTNIIVCDDRVSGGNMTIVAWKPNAEKPNYVWETEEMIGYHKDAFTHWMLAPMSPGDEQG